MQGCMVVMPSPPPRAVEQTGSVPLVGVHRAAEVQTHQEAGLEALWSFEDTSYLNIDLPDGHLLYKAIMPIVVRRAETWEVAGTAFAIGPQAAMTAAHTLVFDSAARIDQAFLFSRGNIHEDGTITGGLLPIREVNTNGTDLALLTLDVPTIDEELLRMSLSRFPLHRRR
jgi:hypothetical protein